MGAPPPFRADGTLPPYTGDFVKLARSSEALAPYRITCVQLVEIFATTPRRKQLLRGFFRYRSDLRKLDLRWATQWIAGSFTELGRQPRDIDCATFGLVPDDWFDANGIRQERVAEYTKVLDSKACVSEYGVDGHLALVNHLIPAMHAVHAWYALYSHTKDDRWKGFFELPFAIDRDTQEDAEAIALIGDGLAR